tara:strand:+ start:830 stop:1093 length:264 start_codon:yes stop_codon:yes gene_type:complete
MKVQITNIDSKIIHTFSYDYENRKMLLSFGGRDIYSKYEYMDVPENVVIDFLQAESKGKYINSIKNDYEYEKVEAAEGTFGQPSNLI